MTIGLLTLLDLTTKGFYGLVAFYGMKHVTDAELAMDSALLPVVANRPVARIGKLRRHTADQSGVAVFSHDPVGV